MIDAIDHAARSGHESGVMRCVGCAVAALFIALVPAMTGGAQMATTTIDIAAMAVGGAPTGFTGGLTGQGTPGAWSVVADASAAGGRAIAQTSADKTDYRFPLAIHQGVSAADVEVSLRFKPVGGAVDQAGGIAVRLASPDDYYVVRANALEDNVRLYAVIDGDRRQFAGHNIKVTPNQWHTLRLRAVGDRFTLYFDGTPLFEAADQRISEPGRVALWTKADSLTEFVDLAIERLP